MTAGRSTAARGRLWNDVLHAVDLDRRPVGLHGGDLAAEDAPQQTGAVQVIQRARWMTSGSARKRLMISL
jgi:hypothetical protein